jgi:hypothetical protein
VAWMSDGMKSGTICSCIKLLEAGAGGGGGGGDAAGALAGAPLSASLEGRGVMSFGRRRYLSTSSASSSSSCREGRSVMDAA